MSAKGTLNKEKKKYHFLCMKACSSHTWNIKSSYSKCKYN